MGLGDAGADEFGNTTRLSISQQQYFINLALSMGASQADIDAFIHNNGVNDLGRIVSALGLTTSPTPSIGTSGTAPSYSAVIQATPPPPLAAPTPVSSAVGALTQTSANDGSISGSGGGSTPESGLRLAYSSNGAEPLQGAVMGPSGVPAWAILVAVAMLVFLFMEKR